MVYGIGIDSALISRLEKSMEKEHFCRRVFHPQELAMLEKLADHRRYASASANFAAKEAFLKAVGTGLGGFELAGIAALRRESGEPYYLLSGKAAAFCEEKRLKAFLSITHEGGVATAFCLLEVCAL